MSTASPRRPGWPLIAYFAVVGALVLLPAVAAGVYVHQQSDSDARQSALDDSNFAASRAAAGLETSFDTIRSISLPIASDANTAQAFVTGTCTVGYGSIGVFATGHVDIVRPDGSDVCTSSRPAPSGPIYAGQSWLQVTSPTVIAPIADAVTGNQVVVFAFPVPGRGVIAWFLDLVPLGPTLGSEFGSGSHQLDFMVVSQDGSRIVIRSSYPARWVGASLAGAQFAQATDPTDRADVNGERRWYGQATVATPGWKVYAGADQAAAMAAASRLQTQQLTIIGAGLVIVLVALFIVYRRVAAPIASLSRTVITSSRQALPTPVRVAGPAEVFELGEGVNALVSSVRTELSERRQVEQNYRVLFENSPLPMWLFDVESLTVLQANAAAEKAYGYSADEFKGLNVNDLVSPELRPVTHEVVAAALPIQRSAAVRHMRKDGSSFEVRASAHNVTFGGRPARFVLAEDASEREKLERQFTQSRRLDSLGRLAGGIAHDFEDQVGEILRGAAAGDIDRIQQAAQSATRLTHKLLAFAQREDVSPRPVDVNAMVNHLDPQLRRTLGENISLVTTLGDDLPSVMADPHQLEQVLTDLAVNARDAMGAGGTLTIDTTDVATDEGYAAGRSGLLAARYVRLRVSDTGTGMTPAVLEHAFEPFFTTKSNGAGTGLGLASVYGIVTQAKGNVTIYSEVGVGTRVSVLLPATE
jgi:PAS domain S-box-containing protein